MQLLRHSTCLALLNKKTQPFIWTPHSKASFDMLHLQLANTPIVQLQDPSKPYFLFMDSSKHFYSGVLIQTSKDESIKALLLISNNAPLTSVMSQTPDLKLHSISIHPVAYISGSFTESQCRWSAITKECFGIFMSIKKCSFYLQNSDLLVQLIINPSKR